MQDVAGTIFEGAVAFIRRQYTTIGILAVVGAVVIGVVITLVETRRGRRRAEARRPADRLVMTGVRLPRRRRVLDGVGDHRHVHRVKANVRTASAARRSLVEAVQVAMRGGAVSGFLVVALSLLGVWGIFTAIRRFIGDVTVAEAPFLIVGFGFGASFVALFAQLGGGIYTKAADVGSDLVGKVEKGIPEDDPRNAGVVADLVGDNVGDCAGRGADLFEIDRRREHRRDDPRRRRLRHRRRRPAGRTPRPGSSSRSSSAPSASWRRSSRSSSSAARKTRTR